MQGQKLISLYFSIDTAFEKLTCTGMKYVKKIKLIYEIQNKCKDKQSTLGLKFDLQIVRSFLTKAPELGPGSFHPHLNSMQICAIALFMAIND